MEQLFQTLSNKYSWETFPLWSYPKLFNYLQGDQTPAQRHDRQVLFKLGFCPLGFCGCSSFFSSIFQRCSWIQISVPLSDFFLFDLERESPAPSGPHAFSVQRLCDGLLEMPTSHCKKNEAGKSNGILSKRATNSLKRRQAESAETSLVA